MNLFWFFLMFSIFFFGFVQPMQLPQVYPRQNSHQYADSESLPPQWTHFFCRIGPTSGFPVLPPATAPLGAHRLCPTFVHDEALLAASPLATLAPPGTLPPACADPAELAPKPGVPSRTLGSVTSAKEPSDPASEPM